jgi:hypothetical protein
MARASTYVEILGVSAAGGALGVAAVEAAPIAVDAVTAIEASHPGLTQEIVEAVQTQGPGYTPVTGPGSLFGNIINVIRYYW